MHCNKNPYMLSRVFTKVITAPFSPNFAPKILAKLVKVTCRSARERAMRYPFSHNHGSVENGDLEDDWLVSFWGPFSTEPWLWEEGYVCVCVFFFEPTKITAQYHHLQPPWLADHKPQGEAAPPRLERRTAKALWFFGSYRMNHESCYMSKIFILSNIHTVLHRSYQYQLNTTVRKTSNLIITSVIWDNAPFDCWY